MSDIERIKSELRLAELEAELTEAKKDSDRDYVQQVAADLRAHRQLHRESHPAVPTGDGDAVAAPDSVERSISQES